ncbi:MAG: LUD domain-containing protein, partial [Vallitaleaceae bacterium]|nr:LUD domain-containing protein [Vallitaleaceae bacterium]
MNTLRLNKNTPCAKTGFCHQCLGTESICCQTVITRLSRDPGRIHVILVGEALGY